MRHDQSEAGRELQAGRIGVPRLSGLVGAVVTPLTVVLAVIPTAYAVTGVTAVPLAFLIVPVFVALFAPGFLAMSRSIDNPGAFYAYCAAGLGPAVGVAAALVALVSYGALLAGLFGVIGSALDPFLAPAGVQLPWPVVAVAVLAVVTAMALLRISIPATVVLVAVLADIVWVLGTVVVLLAHPAEGTSLAGTAARAFSPWGMLGGLATATLVAVLSIEGFETVVVHRRSVRDGRTVGRTLRILLVGLVVLYVPAAFAPMVALGPDRVVDGAREHGPQLLPVLVGQHLPAWWVGLGAVLFAAGVLAAMVSFVVTVAMYAYGLGRDRVLPAAFGQLSARTGAPTRAVLALAGVTFLVVLGAASAGLHPVTHLFFGAGAIGALGVLGLLTTTAVAIVVHLRRHPDGAGRWSTRIIPAAAAVGLAALLTLALARFQDLLDGPIMVLRWTAPAVLLAVALGGVVWARWLRTHRPDIHARIGTSGRALPTPATEAAPR